MTQIQPTDHVVLVSSDTHVGPRLVEDLRPYCPSDRLAEFDMFAKDVEPVRQWWLDAEAPGAHLPGHYDSAARAADMNTDGVAAEVIFHFSFNGELIPFVPSFASADNPIDTELAAIGLHIYNAWLADFCKDLPGRRAGLAHLPLWDLDAAVKELEWAADAGLRGVNFPAMRPNLLPFDDPAYDRFWAAAQDLDMPLTTHAGAVDPTSYNRMALLMLEVGGSAGRRAIHRLIFAGIFDRFPGLKLVMTEQPGLWQKLLFLEMDTVYKAAARHIDSPDTGAITRNSVKGNVLTAPRPSKWAGLAVNTIRQDRLRQVPSEYFHTNVFVGASFLAHFEAVEMLEAGFDDTMMWGSDYPHPEGLHNSNDADPETSQFRRALQNTFQQLPYEAIERMAGATAARVYGLDFDHLGQVARDINAPTFATLTTPPTGELRGADGTGGLAFRTEYWT